MVDDNAMSPPGPANAETVLGQMAPAIHALETKHQCEITIEVKSSAPWLLVHDFPLPPEWAELKLPVSLVWHDETAALYLPIRHVVTQTWAKVKPELLQPPEGTGATEAGAHELSPEGLWAQGWTRCGVSKPLPSLGQSFATLVQSLAHALPSSVQSPAPSAPLTDMDRVRRGLEPPEPPPFTPIAQDELFHRLSSTVHGQEQALRAVSSEIAIHLAKTSPNRPAVLLAVGPTGVGKTRTAEAIAPALNALRPDAEPTWQTVRINMSEYKESHRVSQLLGAPAGYVGYAEKSQLVQALASGYRSVLVFDEIEKAHEDFFEILMAAMDEGVFTAPHAVQGGKANQPPSHQLNCKESIIVLTSNLDQEGMVAEYQESHNPLEVEAALRERLVVAGVKPEIVNRLGRCVVFLPIAPADRADIVLTAMVETAREYGLEVKYVCPDLVIDVLRRTPSKAFGARAERRMVSWVLGDAFVQARRDGLHDVRLLSGPSRCEAWKPLVA